jgi:hypothetical protein
VLAKTICDRLRPQTTLTLQPWRFQLRSCRVPDHLGSRSTRNVHNAYRAKGRFVVLLVCLFIGVSNAFKRHSCWFITFRAACFAALNHSPVELQVWMTVSR